MLTQAPTASWKFSLSYQICLQLYTEVKVTRCQVWLSVNWNCGRSCWITAAVCGRRLSWIETIAEDSMPFLLFLALHRLGACQYTLLGGRLNHADHVKGYATHSKLMCWEVMRNLHRIALRRFASYSFADYLATRSEVEKKPRILFSYNAVYLLRK